MNAIIVIYLFYGIDKMKCEICGKELESSRAMRLHMLWHDEKFRRKKTEQFNKIRSHPKKRYAKRKFFYLPVDESQIKLAKEKAKKEGIYISDALKRIIADEIYGKDNSKTKTTIQRGDVDGLMQFIENQKIEDGTYLPIQVNGIPGSGKTTTMKKLIQKYSDKYKFVVIDFEKEYDFLHKSEVIPDNITRSIRLCPDDNILVRDTVFAATHSTRILSKERKNTIFIIEEAESLGKEAENLLDMARKRKVILITVSPRPIVDIDGYPQVRIVR